MYIVLIVLIVIASILLTFFVLVQNSKGGGLAAGFQSSNQIMGVRKTTDFLEKATWVLVSFIVVLAIATVAVKSKQSGDNVQTPIKKEIQTPAQSQTQPVSTPNFGNTAKPSNSQPTPSPQKK